MDNRESYKIILFDGVCNLCNGAITFIIKRDKKDVFRYAALQSEIGEQLVKERNIDTTKVDSFILIEPGVAYYTKSTAALKIGQTFGGAWKLLAAFEWVPRVIRDWCYDIVAKNRYRWFGRKDACMIPTPELRAKFLG
ncbi:MAG: thiol-disulfide oxidoreductase DCC family protein [Saonia sp.]